MFNRIRAIAKKEGRQLMRDIRMLMVLFIFPVFLLAIFGYAINFDVKHIKIAVYDLDRSSDSRAFVNSMLSSEYFDLVAHLDSDHQIKEYLDQKKAQAIVVFPENMSELINTGRQADVQFLIDGVDGNTATIISNYLNLSARSYSAKVTASLLSASGGKMPAAINVQPRFWFNPELKSTHFLLPGLIAMILIITAVISISLSIVREKERGTIEQINVSPLRTLELMIGKTIPYVIVAFANAGIILLAGNLLFGIVIKGSIFWLMFSTLIFLFASLCLGIFVSTISNSQQVAFQLATMISMLPSIILSGFIFPISSMPVVLQILTNITPSKFYIIILRAIMLRGVGIEAFWDQLVYLIIFSILLLLLAVIRYKKTEAAA